MTEVSLKNKFSETITELVEIKNAYDNRTRKIVEDAIKSLFLAVPELEAIQWTQYTPYFNDGDECVFSINEMSFVGNKNVDPYIWNSVDFENHDPDDIDGILDGDCYNSFLKSYWYGKVDEYATEVTRRYDSVIENIGQERCDEILETLRTFQKLMNQCEDAVRAAYGDHSKVTLYRQNNTVKIDVQDYDHD